ncbi:hypothetical protein QMZ92_35800 [Streptomyces sp. HNM0645]|uniref:glycosyltransferase n=1 Tax=Streptomyces sp. HNM0645 TaxID=2782343 RepID=UPI0024B6742E|nr:nucleotide disphospho-sugar-binding domain-containing protein [Streptomyces sp. HNM0645]MDI9889516.1 hypothetical protein [Streptomyces sp. HNM0645]
MTLGTVIEDPAMLAALLDSLAPLDVNVVVAPRSSEDLGVRPIDPTRVCLAGFVPTSQLLDGTGVVVSSAGAGDLVAALSAAHPMVLLPMGLDKPVNAARAAEAGAAVVNTYQVGAAVARVLDEPALTRGSAEVARENASMNSADEVLRLLLRRLAR